MHGPYKDLQTLELETNRDLSVPWPFSSRSDYSAVGHCFIPSPATLLKTCFSKGTFWSVLKSWNLCLPMQGDKFHLKKHQKTNKQTNKKTLQNPQNHHEKSHSHKFYKICCHTTTIVTRDRRIEVWGFTNLPHRGVYFLREEEVVTKIAEAGVHDILFILFQLIHPHTLKGCSVFLNYCFC